VSSFGLKAAPLFAIASLVAPFQCPHDPDPSQVREDTPGEALYGLAEDFAQAGDKEAQIRTLRYIADKYPRSRFAVRAREELASLGVVLPDASVSPDPNREGVPLGRLPGDPTSSPSSSAAPPTSAAPITSAETGASASTSDSKP